MRKSLKLGVGVFTFILSLILVTSCEKDLYEDTLKNNSEKIKVTDVSISNLDIETAKRINQKISNLKSEANKKEEGKFEYNSSLGFYIDTEDGKLIEKDGKLFYTFPMFRESEDKLENVVFTTKSNGELEAFLVKYNITPEEYLNSANNDDITVEYEKFGAGELCVDMITYITVYPDCPYPNGEHPNGVRCLGETTVNVVTICSRDGGGGNDSGSGDSSTGTGTETGTSGQNSPLGGTGGIGAASDVGEIITVTTPLSQQQINIRDFILSLNEEQSDWYFGQEPDVTNSIIGYLIQNNFSVESNNFISLMINEIMNTSDNPFDNNTIILNNLQDNITDIKNYLKCFNVSQGATFTIYVDQPIANSNASHDGDEVGHTFISIRQGNIRRVLGFYPSDSVTPGIDNTSPGALLENGYHEYDVALSYNITPNQLNNVINYIKNNSHSVYNLNTYNCTDFGMGVANASGLALPSAYGSWGLGGGDNPGQLGQNIRNMPTPNGAIKTTSSGNAQPTVGNCN